MIELHDKVILYVSNILDIFSATGLSVNYINQFHSDINQTLDNFTYLKEQNLDFLESQNREQLKINH
jgi:hypothetical protein